MDPTITKSHDEGYCYQEKETYLAEEKIVSVAKAIKSKAKKRQSPKGRSKRIRKNPYEPEDFSMHEVERIEIMAGRGEKLKDFPSVRSSIENSKRTKEEILAAHRFVFGKKGKYSKKELKDHLLNFSKFLKPIPTGKKRTDDDINKDEEAIEVDQVLSLLLSSNRVPYSIFFTNFALILSCLDPQLTHRPNIPKGLLP